MTIADVPSAKSFYIKQDVEGIKRLVQTMAINLNIFCEEIGDIDGSVECLRVWSSAILGQQM
jgi:hypothetical protein